MGLDPGNSLGHYQIIGLLGAGGMGEVYRARDERLDREVAIKVLPEAVADHPDRLARFEREARAVARLSDSSILQIYELGEHEGRPFMVTELLEGETLRERLDGGPLGWRQASEIGAAIADGLAVAHRADLVHRDLKPSNVFLTTEGRVKLLDFGLALSLGVPQAGSESPTLSRYTAPGTVVGSFDYMSPEQARGEPADHRSDLFSLGCVLHEMVTGEAPFHRATAAETMAAILRDETPGMESGAGGPPPGYRRLVRRCLEKRPGARYPSAAQVAVGLRAVEEAVADGVAVAETATRSIAVLPFANLSPDPENAYFADGLSEEILTDLSRIGSLRVTSRTSAWKFKGAREDIPTVAAQLGVRYVLEGSVRRAGERLRITAQLVDAPVDAHLWAGKYDGTMDDVFDIQEKVSRAIVEQLELRLTPEEARRIAERPIEDVHAYECYLKARDELWVLTRESFDRALLHLQNGLEISGENALLLAGMGYARFQRTNMGFGQEEGTARAEVYANRALGLNPESTEAHLVLGLVHMLVHGDQQRAVTHMKHALESDPNNYEVLIWLPALYVWLGKPAAAEPLLQRLQMIDPLNPRTAVDRFLSEAYSGRFEAALERLEVVLENEPENILLQDAYAWCLAYAGRHDELGAFVGTFDPEAPDDAMRRLVRLLRHAVAGDRDGARRLMDDELVRTSRRDFRYSHWVADALARLGEEDQALDWLENAFSRGFVNYPFLAEHDPFLESLRGEPAFQDYLDRVKDAWERFEV